MKLKYESGKIKSFLRFSIANILEKIEGKLLDFYSWFK
jgi:hypothetical protein